jgi:hypothetical protein
MSSDISKESMDNLLKIKDDFTKPILDVEKAELMENFIDSLNDGENLLEPIKSFMRDNFIILKEVLKRA